MTTPPTGTPACSSDPLETPVSSHGPALSSPQTGNTTGRRALAAPPRPTRAYPWLLFVSTAMAALFCFMYITKPVMPLAAPLGSNALATTAKQPVVAENPTITKPLADAEIPATAQPPAGAEKSTPPLANMLPDAERLPGDTRAPLAAKASLQADPHQALPVPSPASPFEETNLQIQHVLTAATPGGDLSRIVLNVPVLYQSRNLGWTESEVAESRDLLKRLTTYQENSRALREEGTQLLTAWNHLIDRSIPSPVLRADSPSLPANQDQAERHQAPAGLDTTESIQIQPADK